ALLDISKLDAGVLSTNLTAVPIARLLNRIEDTFAGAAREKGLSFRVVSSSAWVHSDVILLERVLLNLVSNAVRYTSSGGIVVGCRKRDQQIHIEVCDTGPGIPEDQQRNIFGEFYRLSKGDTHGGLGLGLAIVDRLCKLLDHPIELTSVVGKGSRFSVVVPAAPAQSEFADPPGVNPIAPGGLRDKLVVVIDDDTLVLDAIGGELRKWGCRVVATDTFDSALRSLEEHGPPDLIISDYRLANNESGIATIARLRAALGTNIPAFLL